jgi:GH15 family glucan-1,4-alpha-glucosidase
MPRFDSEPCFGRLLDWHHAGYCRIAPAQDACDCTRRYLYDTMVLCTRFETETGSVRLYDYGYDQKRGIFVQSFDNRYLDAAPCCGCRVSVSSTIGMNACCSPPMRSGRDWH